MKRYRLPNTTLEVSRIAYGCMRLGRWHASEPSHDDVRAALEAIGAALDEGITLFDHADIYGRGQSEKIFAAVWDAFPGIRDRIVVQSKCGIRFADNPPGAPQRYDFSYEHIVAAVEGSLRRLGTDYLDILLLHRPDPLVEPDEVARAFDFLLSAGKVRYFGVSNHTPEQIALLQAHLDRPLIANQLQLSLLHAHMIDAGIVANRSGVTPEHALAAGTLDFCRRHDILVQAWGPVDGGRLFDPPADAPANVRETAALITDLAEEMSTTREAIALAWLLRHPAGIQPIIGTTNPARVRASCRADALTLSRETWYRLYIAARGDRLP